MTDRHNVIVLVFDTLRSDHPECYGGDASTPAFDGAADRGTRFESAFTTAPGTPISHASLYSGQYPSEHGVTGQYIPLPEEVPVTAEWYRDAGYDTFGITGPAKMGSDWGYDRGFDELFEPYYDLPAPTSWRNVTRSFTDARFRRFFLRQLTRGGHERTRFKFELLRDRIEDDLDRPFLAVCNFTTVHSPYDPPRPYKELARPDFSRPRLFLTEFLLDRPGTIDDPDVRMDRVRHMQERTADAVGRYLADPDFLNEQEEALLRDWYRASVEFLDDELARFLDYYRRELRDDTILVLTADHGEQLGKHGLWEHSHLFYDGTVRVPLVFLGPGIPTGHTREDLASLVDVFPTLCDRCGLDSPEVTSGIPLFSGVERTEVFMEYGERDTADFAAESPHGRYLDTSQIRDLCAGRKAIRTAEFRFEIDSNGGERLYALPGQRLIPDPPPGVTDRLRDRLLETLGDDFGFFPEGDPEDAVLTDEVEENLQRLGYLT